MFIEFQLPQDCIEGSVQAFDEDGKEVRVSRIVFTPYFFTPTSIPVVLYASLFKGTADERKRSDKSALQRCVLTVSGRKSNMRFQDRTEHVTPLCEDSKAKEKGKEAANVGSTTGKASSR